MNYSHIGTKEHPYVMRINRRNKSAHLAVFSTGLNELVAETGAKNVSVRCTFGGTPYLSLHDDAADGANPEDWKRIFKIQGRPRAFRLQGIRLIRKIVKELPGMDDAKVIDLVLVPMKDTDSDSLMDLEFREWSEVKEGNDGTIAQAEDTPAGKDDTTVEQEPVSDEEPAAGTECAAAGQEPDGEGDPDAPGSDIWMRMLYCDNGYVVRNDAGVMMVIHSGGSSNKAIGKHLGAEIMDEINDLEIHALTEKPICGWEVKVSVRAIMKPEEFFGEGK